MACTSPTAESYYLRGRELREKNQPVEAMQAFIAATRVRSQEYTFRARSYSNMATMCRIAERHDLAYALYEQSLRQFALAHDTLAQAYALNNMAWEQAVQSHKTEAFLLIDSALSICPDTAVQQKVLESRAAACLYAAEYDSVIYYIRQSPTRSVYFDILLAQTYAFLEQNDSAVHYARLVCAQTTNPRYLDDALYVLAHCNAEAEADDIRALAETRTDVQRSLERNSPEWMQAVQLAEASLLPENAPMRPEILAVLIAVPILLAVALTLLFFWLRYRRLNTLENQCRLLRQCPNLREELRWNDYPQFSAICNERLGGIVLKLERRELSEREIRICVLVLIGLSYAQMAEVLYRAESGIGKDKYLIAKHLGVSVKDLQTTLFSIAHEPLHA